METIFIGFTGAYQDPVTSTYPLGNGYRWYLPGLMRFNTPDDFSPFGAGGINPYAYCTDDPINYSDPSGHGALTVVEGMVLHPDIAAWMTHGGKAFVEGEARPMWKIPINERFSKPQTAIEKMTADLIFEGSRVEEERRAAVTRAYAAGGATGYLNEFQEVLGLVDTLLSKDEFFWKKVSDSEDEDASELEDASSSEIFSENLGKEHVRIVALSTVLSQRGQQVNDLMGYDWREMNTWAGYDPTKYEKKYGQNLVDKRIKEKMTRKAYSKSARQRWADTGYWVAVGRPQPGAPRGKKVKAI